MVSVIITTYNRKKIIARSLDSILNQTYNDLEIIVVDDASTDGTEEFIKEKYQDLRIRYYKFDTNLGSTAARNFGLDKMSGDYFLVWDSDDYLYPNAIQEILNIFSANSNLAVVSAPARCLLGGREIEFKKMPVGILPKESFFCRLLSSNHKVKIARSSLCGDVRYKAKNIDFLVNVELAEKGPWFCLDKYLADVILESDSNSLTVKRRKTNLDLSILRAEYLFNYLIKHKEVLKEVCPATYAAFSYGASIGFFADKNKKMARELIGQAIKYDASIKYRLIWLLYRIPFGSNLLKFAVKIKNKLLLDF